MNHHACGHLSFVLGHNWINVKLSFNPYFMLIQVSNIMSIICSQWVWTEIESFLLCPAQFWKDSVIWEFVSLLENHFKSCSVYEYFCNISVYLFLYIFCSFPLHQYSIIPVSSVLFSLQSLPPPTSPQPEVKVSTPSTPPPDLVMEEDESPGQRTVEVAIPNVGTFVIESEEGGYDDEVALAQTNLLSLFVLRSLCLFDIWSESIFAHSHGSTNGFSHLRKSDYLCQLILGLAWGWKCCAIRLTSLFAFCCYSCVKSLLLGQSASWHKGRLTFNRKLKSASSRHS